MQEPDPYTPFKKLNHEEDLPKSTRRVASEAAKMDDAGGLSMKTCFACSASFRNMGKRALS